MNSRLELARLTVVFGMVVSSYSRLRSHRDLFVVSWGFQSDLMALSEIPWVCSTKFPTLLF